MTGYVSQQIPRYTFFLSRHSFRGCIDSTVSKLQRVLQLHVASRSSLGAARYLLGIFPFPRFIRLFVTRFSFEMHKRVSLISRSRLCNDLISHKGLRMKKRPTCSTYNRRYRRSESERSCPRNFSTAPAQRVSLSALKLRRPNEFVRICTSFLNFAASLTVKCRI